MVIVILQIVVTGFQVLARPTCSVTGFTTILWLGKMKKAYFFVFTSDTIGCSLKKYSSNMFIGVMCILYIYFFFYNTMSISIITVTDL
jgi:hypothetical protein